MQEPICGWPWYRKHEKDHTHAEIEALTITVSTSNGSRLTIPNRRASKGIIKDLVKSKLKGASNETQ